MSTSQVTSSYIRRALPVRLAAYAAEHGHISAVRNVDDDTGGHLGYFINGVELTPQQLGHFMEHDELP